MNSSDKQRLPTINEDCSQNDESNPINLETTLPAAVSDFLRDEDQHQEVHLDNMKVTHIVKPTLNNPYLRFMPAAVTDAELLLHHKQSLRYVQKEEPSSLDGVVSLTMSSAVVMAANDSHSTYLNVDRDSKEVLLQLVSEKSHLIIQNENTSYVENESSYKF